MIQSFHDFSSSTTQFNAEVVLKSLLVSVQERHSMFFIFRTRRNDLLNETFGGDKCRLHWDLPEHYYEEV